MEPRSPNSPSAFTDLRPKSAYVHVPFCKHRCGYCNFTVVAGRDELVDIYLDALERELQMVLQQPTQVHTLFLGGGTPTQLSGARLERLLNLLSDWLPVDTDGEYSCEANPLDCVDETLATLRRHGVNRLSLGGQSFQTDKLQLLERDHSGGQLAESLELCSRHFSNLSLDLIFAAPKETLAQWQDDMSRALASPICHLSTYGLTFERGAGFWGRMLRGELQELESDLQLEMYELAIDELTSAGWQHYEVSNFCQPGFECRHNAAYWQGDFWWAFGPGASSFLPTGQASDQPRYVRATNHRSTTSYVKMLQAGKSPIHESDELDQEQLVRERLVFGLRQMAGVDWAWLQSQWPQPLETLFQPYLQRYLDDGWVERIDGRLRLTRRGLVISDSLWPDLLEPDR